MKDRHRPRPPGFQIRPANAGDTEAVLALLRQAQLPTGGLIEALPTAVVAVLNGAVVGGAAVEVWPPYGLLRSVVIAPTARGQGLARYLVEAAMNLAAEKALSDVFLLTTTAVDYFKGLGFVAVERDRVPLQIQNTTEFSSLCPASAVVMTRAATPSPRS